MNLRLERAENAGRLGEELAQIEIRGKTLYRELMVGANGHARRKTHA